MWRYLAGGMLFQAFLFQGGITRRGANKNRMGRIEQLFKLYRHVYLMMPCSENTEAGTPRRSRSSRNAIIIYRHFVKVNSVVSLMVILRDNIFHYNAHSSRMIHDLHARSIALFAERERGTQVTVSVFIGITRARALSLSLSLSRGSI